MKLNCQNKRPKMQKSRSESKDNKNIHKLSACIVRAFCHGRLLAISRVIGCNVYPCRHTRIRMEIAAQRACAARSFAKSPTKALSKIQTDGRCKQRRAVCNGRSVLCLSRSNVFRSLSRVSRVRSSLTDKYAGERSLVTRVLSRYNSVVQPTYSTINKSVSMQRFFLRSVEFKHVEIRRWKNLIVSSFR